MQHHPLLSLRSPAGLTSVTHCNQHLLTTSITGELCKWDRGSGNRIYNWKVKDDLVSALPLYATGSQSHRNVALQHKNGVCLFDTTKSAIIGEFNISASNFSRVRVLEQEPSLLLCPSGLTDIACVDIRTRCVTAAIINGTSDHIASTTTYNNESAHSKSEKDIGSLQNFEPLPHLGHNYIAATYECGTISIYDIRKSTEPVFSSDACSDVEGLPSLAVWRSVLLVGDTNGGVSMFHVSNDEGVSLLLRERLCDTDPASCVAGCLRIRQDGAITVAGCWDKNIRILETRNLSVKLIFDYHKDSITDVSFDHCTGEFATSALDGNAHVWNI